MALNKINLLGCGAWRVVCTRTLEHKNNKSFFYYGLGLLFHNNNRYIYYHSTLSNDIYFCADLWINNPKGWHGIKQDKSTWWVMILVYGSWPYWFFDSQCCLKKNWGLVWLIVSTWTIWAINTFLCNALRSLIDMILCHDITPESNKHVWLPRNVRQDKNWRFCFPNQIWLEKR